jgi:hypothetical protein
MKYPRLTGLYLYLYPTPFLNLPHVIKTRPPSHLDLYDLGIVHFDGHQTKVQGSDSLPDLFDDGIINDIP